MQLDDTAKDREYDERLDELLEKYPAHIDYNVADNSGLSYGVADMSDPINKKKRKRVRKIPKNVKKL